MLSNMRKRVRIIMIVVAVAFVAGFLLGELWTVLRSRGRGVDPREQGVVAMVGDRKVTETELRGAIAYNTDRYREEHNLRDLSAEDYEAVERRAWLWLINELVWQRLIDETGVTSTYDEVLEIMRANPPADLRNNPSLLDSAGNFDYQLYHQAIESEQNRPYFARYFQELADMLPKEKLRIDMSNSFRITPGELTQIRSDEGELIAATALYFGPRLLGETPAQPTDEEARQYYEANREEFRTQSRRHLAYVHIPLGHTAADSLEARTTIERAQTQLEAGESFNLSILDFTDLMPETLSAHYLRSDLDDMTDSVIGMLRPGQFSEPFLTSYGWQIITLDTITPDSVTYRRIIVRVKMGSETISRVRDEVVSFLDLVRSVGFDSLAAERNLQVQRHPPLFGDEPRLSQFELNDPDRVIRWMVDAKAGDIMPDPAFGPAGYYILKLTEYSPSFIPEFEDSRHQASWRARQHKDRQVWDDRAREVLAEIRAGRSLESFGGEETGIDLVAEEYTGLADCRRRQGPEFAGALRALDPGQISGVVNTTWGAFIIRCDHREPFTGFDSQQIAQERYNRNAQRIITEMLEPPVIKDYRSPLY